MNKAQSKKVSSGTCAVERINPAKENLSPATPTINVTIPYEEALQLQMALLDRLMKINQMNRATKEGKRAAVNLVIHIHHKRISVMPGKLPSKK